MDDAFVTSINVPQQNKPDPLKDLYPITSAIPEAGKALLEIVSNIQAEIRSIPLKTTAIINEYSRELELLYEAHLQSTLVNVEDLRKLVAATEARAGSDQGVQALELELSWYTTETGRLDKECRHYQSEIDGFKHMCVSWTSSRSIAEDKIKNIKKQNAIMKSLLERAPVIHQNPQPSEPPYEPPIDYTTPYKTEITSLKSQIKQIKSQIFQLKSLSTVLESVKLKNLFNQLLKSSNLSSTHKTHLAELIS